MTSRLPGRSWLLVAWHALALGGVLLLPPLVRWGRPLWSLDESFLPFMTLLGLTYLVGAAALFILRPTTRHRPIVVVSAVAATVLLGLTMCLILVPGIRYARSLVLVGSGLVAALLGVGSRFAGRSPVGLWLPLVLVGGSVGFGLLVADAGAADSRVSGRTEKELQAAQLTVRALSYWNHLPPDELRGGGLEPLGGGYLLARGRGDFFFLYWSDVDSLRVEPLEVEAPANRGDFEADTTGGVESRQFRVADLLVREGRDSVELVVSHHYWFRDRRCFVLRLSSLKLAMRGDSIEWLPAARPEWRTVFDTRPCLPIRREGRLPFAGQQAGGRLLALGGDTVLMTVGDHEFDGRNASAALPQDETAHYGKTLLVDVRTGTAEVFTRGHRNPQGLARAPDGGLWLTEHGPRGGDELNRLVAGGNYGWPYATLGTDYDGSPWPLRWRGDSESFVPPRYAWVPSIGVSAAMFVEGWAFPEWRDDLLVGSLRAGTLSRLELRDERVVYAEPLEFDLRIRDLVEGRDGAIVLWTDEQQILRLSPLRSRTEGAALFRQCQGCHALADGTEHGVGPDLAGVAGSPVAAVRGFAYSQALEQVGGEWTDARLDEFLADPNAFAPGTSMEFDGVEDPEERRVLIEYLKSVKAER